MIQHWYLVWMITVTSPFYWYHIVTLTFALSLDHDLWPISRSNLLPGGGPQFFEFACFPCAFLYGETFPLIPKYLTGLKLPQKSREKSLLPPAWLGRSEILAGRSEILSVAETRRDLPRQLSLYCLCLLFIYFHPIYIQCCVLFKFFHIQ